jgi:quercetin dioxygenase-like cupin family protein
LTTVGQHASDIRTHGVGHTPSGQRFEVELETEGPATISTQDGAYVAGGHNGWHSHPGMVAVTVVSGAIQWFDENCAETDYKAGDSWTEGSKIHYFRVVGTTGVHLAAFFITAQGAQQRADGAYESTGRHRCRFEPDGWGISTIDSQKSHVSGRIAADYACCGSITPRKVDGDGTLVVERIISRDD